MCFKSGMGVFLVTHEPHRLVCSAFFLKCISCSVLIFWFEGTVSYVSISRLRFAHFPDEILTGPHCSSQSDGTFTSWRLF